MHSNTRNECINKRGAKALKIMNFAAKAGWLCATAADGAGDESSVFKMMNLLHLKQMMNLGQRTSPPMRDSRKMMVRIWAYIQPHPTRICFYFNVILPDYAYRVVCVCFAGGSDDDDSDYSSEYETDTSD